MLSIEVCGPHWLCTMENMCMRPIAKFGIVTVPSKSSTTCSCARDLKVVFLSKFVFICGVSVPQNISESHRQRSSLCLINASLIG